MKKLLFLISVFALFTQSIDAAPVTFEQAKAVAQQSLRTKSLMGGNVNVTLDYTARNLKGVTDYYVFNRDGGQGFVIVAGDDLSTPVLGYSMTGSFDMNTAPETLKLMLKDYQQYMEWKRHHPEAAKAPAFTYDLQPYGIASICGDVHWHQFPPYNNLCPRSSHALTSNSRCYAGCAPVAFATIMKGLRHPSYGVGENRYTITVDGQEIEMYANFNHRYNYSDMKNGYGENAYNAQEVSRLMSDVGIAFNTKYSPSSSDASIRNIFKAMVAYFDYNPGIRYLNKNNYQYNEQAWYDMIYEELDNGRPVYYFGYRTLDNEGQKCYIGHAFVMDGYDRNGKVHVNWGFQPEAYNTYFDFELLSPRSNYEYDAYKSGFNTDQSAIMGICADTTDMGGVVVKDIHLVADTMPATDVRATIDVQALSGRWSGTLRYGIVSKTSDGYSPVFSTTANVDIDDNGIATLDLSGSYPYYLYQGRTYYIVVWSPYFTNSYDWNWFLNENPVPFTIGDWVTPPDPEYILGDINDDGKVTISDVTALIDYLLGGEGELPLEVADVNGSGDITIADVTALIDMLLSGNEE